jgi:hypothetical protein
VAGSGDSGQVQAAREVVARLNDPQTGGRYERWIERARGCERPVRLRGTSREADAAPPASTTPTWPRLPGTPC